MQAEQPQPEATPPAAAPKRKRRTFVYVAGPFLLLCAAAILVWSSRRHAASPDDSHSIPSSDPPVEVKAAFNGDSAGLLQTVIVPTLDTPSPKEKNVIWCSSFQIAWNHLRKDVVKGPLKLKNVEAVADRLNLAKQSEAELPPGTYYATAGRVNDGVVQTIQREMAKRFPAVPKPTFDGTGAVLVAYAYLAANLRFTVPFFENHEPLDFTNSIGGKTSVASFGLRGEDAGAYMKLRSQVAVPYTSIDRVHGRQNDFILDPCKDASPNQLLLACIPPKETLAATLRDLEKKLDDGKHDEGNERELGPDDPLLIPDILFDVTHRFKEMEGPDKLLLNPGFDGLWLSVASQQIRFRLDRSGAELASEAKIAFAAKGRVFIFDRPFLIVMKKRGAVEPFFVMWVDNAELLCRP